MAAPVDTMDVDMPVKDEPMDVPVNMEDAMNVDMADVPVNASEPAKATKQENKTTSAVKFVPRVLRIVYGKGSKAATKQEDVEMTEDAGAGPSASGSKLKSQAQLDTEGAARLSRHDHEKGIKKSKTKRRNERRRRARAQGKAADATGKKSRENRVLASGSGSRIEKKDAWRTTKSLEYRGELPYERGKLKGVDKRRHKFMEAMERRGDIEAGKGKAKAEAPELDADLMDGFKAWNLGSSEDKGKGKEVARVPGQNRADGYHADKDAAEISGMLGAMKLGDGHATE